MDAPQKEHALASETFQCTVVTPEQAVFDEAVVYANLPAHDGQMGIMHDRAPLLTELGAGRLDVQLPNGSRRQFDLAGGFAQMNANRLTLLTEKATELNPPTAG
jgi:F-type H+-transporting ATPase subunit epsilon